MLYILLLVGKIADPVLEGIHSFHAGQTYRIVATRFNDHAHSTRAGSSTVGRHFKDQWHNLHHMEMVATDRVRSPDPWIRLAREKQLIRKFDATINKNYVILFINVSNNCVHF